MTDIYERLGVTPIINACGPNTRLSGGIMAPEVAEAMVEASQHCVDMVELQARASLRPARRRACCSVSPPASPVSIPTR